MNSRIHPVRIPFNLPVNAEVKVQRVVFAYLVFGQRLGLIDAGPAGGEKHILYALKAHGKTAADIDMVINTHEHPDHIGGNTFFQAAAKPVFACHDKAVRWIETLDVQYRERPLYAFHTLAGQHGVHIQQPLQDGERIDLGRGMELEFLHCPGHSPGSMAIFCPREGTLIIGDITQPVDGIPLYLDLAQTRASLERLTALPGVEKMYTAWVEKPFTGAGIKAALQSSLDYLDRVDTMVKEVVSTMPADTALEEITRQVMLRLGLDPPPVMAMTMASVKAHLSL